MPTASGAPSAAAVPDAAAVAFLGQVAAAAASAAQPEVGEDQFVYVRSTVRSNTGQLGEAPTVGAAHEREVWLSQDPSVRGGERDVLREFGQDWELGYGDGGVPAGLLRPTYAWWRRCRRTPTPCSRCCGASWAWPVARTPTMRRSWPSASCSARRSCRRAPLGRCTRRPLAWTGLPSCQGSRTRWGVPGFALSHTDTSTPVQVRAEWIFSREELTYLGSRSFFVGRGGAPDQLVGADAVLERAVVDEPGRAPAPAASETGA